MTGEDLPVWLVTGDIADKSLAKIAAKFSNVKTIVAPVSVASFLTKNHVKTLLLANPALRSGIIVLPGLVHWDPVPLGEEYDIILVKGPKNATELPAFLKAVNASVKKAAGAAPRDLARLIEAIKITREQERSAYESILAERVAMFGRGSAMSARGAGTLHDENKAIEGVLWKPGRNFTVPGSSLVIGKDFPPAIMAEIINAAEKTAVDIDEHVDYFLRNGTQIIDVGATPGKSSPEALGSIVASIARRCNCPVSIDSLDEKEILAGIDGGARIVLSIDSGNEAVLDSIDKGTVLVMIPTNVKKGLFPKNPGDRVANLAGLITRARDRGFTRIIADPILNSPITPGLIDSIEAFIAFKHAGEENPALDVPVFIGGSNVSEMIDTDSAGVNTMLAIMGIELGACILFTSEDSAKCTGSVKEMQMARDLVFHARLKNTHPKDLAFDAFSVKKKHKAIPSFDIPPSGVDVVDADAKKARPFQADPCGIYFKFFVDQLNGKIVAGAFDRSGLISIVQGTKAESIGKEILGKFGPLSKDHLLYIGRELSRAEDCLAFNSVYIQDEN
nr:dihydropteroate synthase [Candidatus Sigynarchaeota archaeon]